MKRIYSVLIGMISIFLLIPRKISSMGIIRRHQEEKPFFLMKGLKFTHGKRTVIGISFCPLILIGVELS